MKKYKIFTKRGQYDIPADKVMANISNFNIEGCSTAGQTEKPAFAFVVTEPMVINDGSVYGLVFGTNERDAKSEAAVAGLIEPGQRVRVEQVAWDEGRDAEIIGDFHRSNLKGVLGLDGLYS